MINSLRDTARFHSKKVLKALACKLSFSPKASLVSAPEEYFLYVEQLEDRMLLSGSGGDDTTSSAASSVPSFGELAGFVAGDYNVGPNGSSMVTPPSYWQNLGVGHSWGAMGDLDIYHPQGEDGTIQYTHKSTESTPDDFGGYVITFMSYDFTVTIENTPSGSDIDYRESISGTLSAFTIEAADESLISDFTSGGSVTSDQFAGNRITFSSTINYTYEASFDTNANVGTFRAELTEDTLTGYEWNSTHIRTLDAADHNGFSEVDSGHVSTISITGEVESHHEGSFEGTSNPSNGELTTKALGSGYVRSKGTDWIQTTIDAKTKLATDPNASIDGDYETIVRTQNGTIKTKFNDSYSLGDIPGQETTYSYPYADAPDIAVRVGQFGISDFHYGSYEYDITDQITITQELKNVDFLSAVGGTGGTGASVVNPSDGSGEINVYNSTKTITDIDKSTGSSTGGSLTTFTFSANGNQSESQAGIYSFTDNSNIDVGSNLQTTLQDWTGGASYEDPLNTSRKTVVDTTTYDSKITGTSTTTLTPGVTIVRPQHGHVGGLDRSGSSRTQVTDNRIIETTHTGSSTANGESTKLAVAGNYIPLDVGSGEYGDEVAFVAVTSFISSSRNDTTKVQNNHSIDELTTFIDGSSDYTIRDTSTYGYTMLSLTGSQTSITKKTESGTSPDLTVSVDRESVEKRGDSWNQTGDSNASTVVNDLLTVVEFQDDSSTEEPGTTPSIEGGYVSDVKTTGTSISTSSFGKRNAWTQNTFLYSKDYGKKVESNDESTNVIHRTGNQTGSKEISASNLVNTHTYHADGTVTWQTTGQRQESLEDTSNTSSSSINGYKRGVWEGNTPIKHDDIPDRPSATFMGDAGGGDSTGGDGPTGPGGGDNAGGGGDGDGFDDQTFSQATTDWGTTFVGDIAAEGDHVHRTITKSSLSIDGEESISSDISESFDLTYTYETTFDADGVENVVPRVSGTSTTISNSSTTNKVTKSTDQLASATEVSLTDDGGLQRSFKQEVNQLNSPNVTTTETHSKLVQSSTGADQNVTTTLSHDGHDFYFKKTVSGETKSDSYATSRLVRDDYGGGHGFIKNVTITVAPSDAGTSTVTNNSTTVTIDEGGLQYTYSQDQFFSDSPADQTDATTTVGVATMPADVVGVSGTIRTESLNESTTSSKWSKTENTKFRMGILDTFEDEHTVSNDDDSRTVLKSRDSDLNWVSYNGTDLSSRYQELEFDAHNWDVSTSGSTTKIGSAEIVNDDGTVEQTDFHVENEYQSFNSGASVKHTETNRSQSSEADVQTSQSVSLSAMGSGGLHVAETNLFDRFIDGVLDLQHSSSSLYWIGDFPTGQGIGGGGDPSPGESMDADLVLSNDSGTVESDSGQVPEVEGRIYVHGVKNVDSSGTNIAQDGSENNSSEIFSSPYSKTITTLMVVIEEHELDLGKGVEVVMDTFAFELREDSDYYLDPESYASSQFWGSVETAGYYLGLLGGVMEIVGGATVFVVTAPTGVGAVMGTALILHGMDTFYSTASGERSLTSYMAGEGASMLYFYGTGEHLSAEQKTLAGDVADMAIGFVLEAGVGAVVGAAKAAKVAKIAGATMKSSNAGSLGDLGRTMGAIDTSKSLSKLDNTEDYAHSLARTCKAGDDGCFVAGTLVSAYQYQTAPAVFVSNGPITGGELKIDFATVSGALLITFASASWLKERHRLVARTKKDRDKQEWVWAPQRYQLAK